MASRVASAVQSAVSETDHARRDRPSFLQSQLGSLGLAKPISRRSSASGHFTRGEIECFRRVHNNAANQ